MTTPNNGLQSPPRTNPHAQEQIKAMLYRLKDAMSQSSALTTADGHDSRLLLFPPSFNPAYRELDRALTQLRHVDRTAHWHVRAWYVDPDWRQEPRYRYTITAGKRHKLPAGWQMTAIRHPDANHNHAAAGLAQLTRLYRFDHVHLKDLLEATGETHEH